jgi:hypothetical protein
LVCGDIFVLSRNVVWPTKRTIIQELRRWPGQNHELHGLRQTIIKGGNAVMSNQPLQPKKQLLASSKSQKPKSKKRRRKRSRPISKTLFAKLRKHPINPIP